MPYTYWVKREARVSGPVNDYITMWLSPWQTAAHISPSPHNCSFPHRINPWSLWVPPANPESNPCPPLPPTAFTQALLISTDYSNSLPSKPPTDSSWPSSNVTSSRKTPPLSTPWLTPTCFATVALRTHLLQHRLPSTAVLSKRNMKATCVILNVLVASFKR